MYKYERLLRLVRRPSRALAVRYNNIMHIYSIRTFKRHDRTIVMIPRGYVVKSVENNITDTVTQLYNILKLRHYYIGSGLRRYDSQIVQVMRYKNYRLGGPFLISSIILYYIHMHFFKYI